MFLIFKIKFYVIQKKLNDKLKKINNWIDICRKKKLIRGILKSSPKPKITALITLYNSQDYVHIALKSIQNQLFSDIEILMIDDASTDDSLKIIKHNQEEDKRIKIIKNKKNRGALYSKSIGILKANGLYTMILDSDDLFANENIFNICYNETMNNNLDILEFSGYNLNYPLFQLNQVPGIPYYLKFKQDNELIYQPDLSYFIYKKVDENYFRLIDGFLWGKCIKSSIFKMSLKILGSYIYRQKINYGDDRLINFILFKVANSFKYIHEYGIIYNYNNNSITHLNYYINNCRDELVNIMSIYNYTKNNKEIEIVASEIIFRWNIIIYPGLDLNNYKRMKELIKKLLSNKYICQQNKKRLISFTHNLTKTKRLYLFEF